METRESELKLLNLLGFKLVELKEYNKKIWNILDENDNIVGTIQNKRIYNKNKKKGTAAVFGYVTNIESNTLSCKKLTTINNNSPYDSCDNPFFYELTTIKSGEKTDKIIMDLGETPSVKVWSKEHDFMEFSLDYNKIFVNFKIKTEKFNIEELLVYQWDKDEKEHYGDYKREYTYQISYCDKETKPTDDNSKGITNRIIKAKYDPIYQRPNQLEITELTWTNGKLRTHRKNIYDGTVEEVVKKQQMGIDAISRFRHLLNLILPVKQDIMNVMLSKYPYVVEEGIGLLFPDIIEQLKENPCLDCCTSGSCDMLGITEQQCLTLKKHKQITGQSYIKVK